MRRKRSLTALVMVTALGLGCEVPEIAHAPAPEPERATPSPPAEPTPTRVVTPPAPRLDPSPHIGAAAVTAEMLADTKPEGDSPMSAPPTTEAVAARYRAYHAELARRGITTSKLAPAEVTAAAAALKAEMMPESSLAEVTP